MAADEVDQEGALRTALRQSRWSLGLALLLLLGSAGTLLYLTHLWQEGLILREGRILAEAKEHLAEHADEIFAEAADLAVETLPPVADAFADQAEEDLAAYVRAAGGPGGALIDALAASLRQKVRARSKAYLARHRRILREEFPEITDKDQLARLEAEFERVFDQLQDRYFVGELRTASQELLAAYRAIPPAAPPKPGEPKLASRLLDDLGVWAELEFTRAGKADGRKEEGR